MLRYPLRRRGVEERKIRLDRYLVNAGAGSRKEVRELIRDGYVTVNGVVIKDPSYKVSMRDNVRLNNESLSLLGKRYYKMYKPKGVITSTKDRDLTLFDLITDIPRLEDLFPVGRLDKDAEGLILITNDGVLAHRLTHPRWKVRKVYEVTLEYPLLGDEANLLLKGVRLEDGMAKVEDIEVLDEEGKLIRVTVTEGRYHLIKRIFSAIGNRVLSLKRVAFGPITVDDLREGEIRELTRKEIEELFKLCDLTMGDEL